MMSEARTPFSMRPCRAAVRQQEAIDRPVKARVGVVWGGLKHQRERGEVRGQATKENRQVRMRSVAAEL